MAGTNRGGTRGLVYTTLNANPFTPLPSFNPPFAYSVPPSHRPSVTPSLPLCFATFHPPLSIRQEESLG